MLPLLLAFAQGFPPATVPSGWGVNIHFTDEQPGEAAKVGAAFRFARMDFAWGGIERERGRYDFAAYDRLLASLDRAKVRPYFILDYGNDLYQKGSPNTPESRAAFCRWVAAAMARYKGRGVVWEMWNEPNIGFWQPKPNADEYIALAREVGRTIRKVAPREIYIGPATSGFDWPFLQKCLDAGLLEYWDAVSVHPYRQNEPESVLDDWLRLAPLLDRAAPGRNVPMISGEWGYSELYTEQTREKQGDYIVRQYLANLSCGVPISIFYDWKDDGADPKEPEHHFGTVFPDLSPKPAYRAALRLGRGLAGFSYVTRLHTRDARQWLLLFKKGQEARIAGWTTGPPSKASLPGRTVTLTPSVTVLTGPQLAPLLLWKPEPWARVDPLGLDRRPQEFRTWKTVGGARLAQATRVAAVRPLDLTILPERDGGLVAVLDDPNARKVGWGLLDVGNRSFRLSRKTKYPVRVPLGPKDDQVIVTADGRGIEAPVPRFVPLSLAGATAAAEGDAKIQAAVSATPSTEGTRLKYDFAPGWRFVELRTDAGTVEGRPTEYGIWILGDGSGDLLRMRYADATGQTFQPDGGPIDWKGWRYVSFRLDGTGGRWGGANDGKVHYPIRITTLALVDMPGARGGKGAITVARPVLAYER